MFNMALYKREAGAMWRTAAVFAAILTVYIIVIITVYDTEMLGALLIMAEAMPDIFDAMGFRIGDVSLIGFLSSYLYGFILLICPMGFSVLCGHALIAARVESGAMVCLLAAPVKRRAVAFTQMTVMATGIISLVAYTMLLEVAVCGIAYPGELDVSKLLLMNGGLLALHFFIGGVSFFSSCLFSDARCSLGFGAGLPFACFALHMLGNVNGAEGAKYFTFFTLFDPDGLAAADSGAITGMVILFTGAVLLYIAAVVAFSRKDLHI